MPFGMRHLFYFLLYPVCFLPKMPRWTNANDDAYAWIHIEIRACKYVSIVRACTVYTQSPEFTFELSETLRWFCLSSTARENYLGNAASKSEFCRIVFQYSSGSGCGNLASTFLVIPTYKFHAEMWIFNDQTVNGQKKLSRSGSGERQYCRGTYE